ncbi:MAG: hypothetical protein WC510_07485 [Candidatus Omnitrophota bacterium]
MMKFDKKTVEITLTLALILILILLFINSIRRVGRTKRLRAKPRLSAVDRYIPFKKSQQGKGHSLKMKGREGGTFSLLTEETKGLYPVRDPFAQGKKGQEGASSYSLALTGIIWDEENPLAIINDRIVKTGDKVSLNNVVAIKQESVVLNDGTKDFELKLN